MEERATSSHYSTIPRCYSPVGFTPTSVELHGFSDASEEAYAGVVYIRLINSSGRVHTTLVMSKTRVAPVKRLSIPRLELCGAQLLTKLLCHVKRVLEIIPMSSVIAWTDSTVVLSWLTENPRRFKTYVGNRVSFILDQIPPDRWKHVPGILNPADCASRGLFPLDHGSNFVGAKGELKALQDMLSNRITQGAISEFCSSHAIQWKYIPEKSPHFGGIWESAVKSVKNHLKRVVSPVRLTFEEFTTVLTQIEACLNSRPLTPVNSPDDDGVLALTPGHFLIGKALTSLPDSQLSYL